jgi:hypothetical protein
MAFNSKDSVPEQLFQETQGSMQHCLRWNGTVTPWMAYPDLAYLADYVGHTAYHGEKEGVETVHHFFTNIYGSKPHRE